MSIMNRVGDWITGSQIWGSIFRHGAPSAMALLIAPLAAADPYYLRYDADGVFPEESGWTRYYDDAGVEKRSIEEGVLSLDTTGALEIFDLYEVVIPALNLKSGESLRVSWRMQTVDTNAEFPNSDVSVAIVNERGAFAGFYIASSYLIEFRYLLGYDELHVPIAPGEFHTYEFASFDMETYDLYVDSQLAISGEFHDFAWRDAPRVGFGDSVTGYTSVSLWDRVEVSVTPEPASLVVLLVLGLTRRILTWR
ncbi:MAG: hypothetical protein CHACPFDD_04021 [Phycisphaerae bacterium]|nr:hypothetical protein [Phycisphaerae bacterium]